MSLGSSEQAGSGAVEFRSVLPREIAAITTGVIYELRQGGKLVVGGRASYEAGAPFGLRIASLPAVEGYSMTFALVDQAKKQICTGIALFGVQPNRYTKVSVELKCRSTGAVENGGVGVDLDVIEVEEGNCPKLGPIVAQPPVAKVGEPVSLRTRILDQDPSTLELSWFDAKDSGTILSETSSLEYACRAVGTPVLVLRAKRGSCAVQREISVECESDEVVVPAN